MTKEERDIIDLSAELWNRFCALPELHPSDKPELCVHIHAIQNMVFARTGVRSYNKMEQTVTEV